MCHRPIVYAEPQSIASILPEVEVPIIQIQIWRNRQILGYLHYSLAGVLHKPCYSSRNEIYMYFFTSSSISVAQQETID